MEAQVSGLLDEWGCFSQGRERAFDVSHLVVCVLFVQEDASIRVLVASTKCLCLIEQLQ
jgi:hypothetical protein